MEEDKTFYSNSNQPEADEEEDLSMDEDEDEKQAYQQRQHQPRSRHLHKSFTTNAMTRKYFERFEKEAREEGSHSPLIEQAPSLMFHSVL